MTAKITLTWDNGSSEHVDQIVYRSAETFTVDNLPPILARVGRNTREYIDTGIVTGNVYFYAVASENAVGEILLSSVISVKVEVSTGDPHWDNAVSLLHFDGAENGTTFADERGLIWSAAGDAKTKTSLKKWGAAAGDFNGVNSYISTPHSSNMNVGSANFTVEAWVYLRAATAYAILVAKGNSAARELPILLSLDGSGTKAQFGVGIGGVWKIAVSNTTLPLNEWVHIAGVRSGGSLLLFQQGVLVGTAAAVGPAMDNTSPLTIGANAPGNSFANVVVDDFRLTISAARYTENFTPPTEPFPNHS